MEQRQERLARLRRKYPLWHIRKAQAAIGFIATRGDAYVWEPTLDALSQELERLAKGRATTP